MSHRRRLKEPPLFLAAAVAAFVATGATACSSDEDQYVHCIDDEGEVVDPEYCDEDDADYHGGGYWYYVSGTRYSVGNRVPGDHVSSRVSPTDRSGRARRRDPGDRPGRRHHDPGRRLRQRQQRRWLQRRRLQRGQLMLERHPCGGRPLWEESIRHDGVVYSDTTTPGGGSISYWVENAYYQVTEADTDHLAGVCNDLTAMLIEAGDCVITEKLFGKLGIPEYAVGAIVRTWQDDDPAYHWPSVYGRMDLRWGNDPALVARDPSFAEPKLLEYNADTPTCFPESTGAQWNWLMMHPTVRGDQWNNAFEALVAAWKRNLDLYAVRRDRPVTTVHFVHTASESSGEDRMNTALVAAAAEQAGYRVKMQYIEDVKLETLDQRYAFLDGATTAPMGHFLDSDGEPMQVVFKLYPWEWMIHEGFGRAALWNTVQPDGTTWVEPPYKMLWSNKGILPVLWQLFGHDPVRSRYLLPAYFEGEQPPGFAEDCVRKPLLGREGANVTVISGGEVVASKGGKYGAEGYILQRYAELPSFEGVGGPYHALTGVWMIDNEAAGLCFRESTGPITDNLSFFVPHVIKGLG